MSRTDYLAALHAAFDARRDPLDDAAVRDWLSAHPEDLAEFAAMRAALTAPSITQVLPAPAFAPQRRSLLWPMIFPPLAAAAALLLFLRTEHEPAAGADLLPAGLILAASLTETIEPAATFHQPFEGAGVLTTSVSYSRTTTF